MGWRPPPSLSLFRGTWYSSGEDLRWEILGGDLLRWLRLYWQEFNGVLAKQNPHSVLRWDFPWFVLNNNFVLYSFPSWFILFSWYHLKRWLLLLMMLVGGDQGIGTLRKSSSTDNVCISASISEQLSSLSLKIPCRYMVRYFLFSSVYCTYNLEKAVSILITVRTVSPVWAVSMMGAMLQSMG